MYCTYIHADVCRLCNGDNAFTAKKKKKKKTENILRISERHVYNCWHECLAILMLLFACETRVCKKKKNYLYGPTVN